MLKALRSSTLKQREKNKEKINLQVIKKKKRSCSQSVPIQEKKKRSCSQKVPIQEKNKCLQIRSDTLFQEELKRLYCLFSTEEGLSEEQDVVSSSSISSQFDTPASSPTPSLEVLEVAQVWPGMTKEICSHHSRTLVTCLTILFDSQIKTPQIHHLLLSPNKDLSQLV